MRASAYENKVVSQVVLREKVSNANGQIKIDAATNIRYEKFKIANWTAKETFNSF